MDKNNRKSTVKTLLMGKIAKQATERSYKPWPWPPCIGLVYQPEHPMIAKERKLKELSTKDSNM